MARRAASKWAGLGLVWAAGLLAAGACSAEMTDDDDGSGAAATSSSSGSGGSSSGSGGSSSGSGGSSSGSGGSSSGGGALPVVPLCQPACSNVGDCDLGSAPYDPDNYACSDGYCHYTGCNSDAECQTLGSFVCRDIGLGVPMCSGACAVVDDCSTGQAPYDADNYACSDGYCHYTGCNSDAECQALGSYVCR